MTLIMYKPHAGVYRSHGYPTVIPSGAVYKPDASSTGVQSGIALSPYVGDIVVTSPNTIIQNLDIAGFITIKAANCIVKNCIVRGSGPGTFDTGLINCISTACVNALIQHCELIPNTPSYWIDGIFGHDYVAQYCHVHNVSDGFGVFNSAVPSAAANVLIEGNYYHDNYYVSPNPDAPDNASHNDGVQIQGNSNITIRGNNFRENHNPSIGTPGPTYIHYGAGVTVSPNVSAVTGLTITGNWFQGGEVGIQMNSAQYSGGSNTIGTISGNYFSVDQFNFGTTPASRYQIRMNQGLVFAGLTTNQFDPNDAGVQAAGLAGVFFTEGRSGGLRINGID